MTLPVEPGKSYTFKVVPIYEIDEKVFVGAEKTTTFNNTSVVSLKHQKYSFSRMKKDMNRLKKKYNNYITIEKVGKSEEGRGLYDVILGDKNAKKSLLVVSAIHAREYVTTVTCMKQLEYYLEHYNEKLDGKRLSKVFKECNVHFVMMANPDGVTISQDKKPGWKANSRGVDLNKNFPYRFKVEGKKSGAGYSGKKSASESETQALIALTQKLKDKGPVAVVNYHAMGQIVFGDYKGQNIDMKNKMKSMYDIARYATGYFDAKSYGDGIGRGNYREYLMYVQNIPSITIEVGKTACPVSQKEYKQIFQDNKLVVLRIAKII